MTSPSFHEMLQELRVQQHDYADNEVERTLLSIAWWAINIAWSVRMNKAADRELTSKHERRRLRHLAFLVRYTRQHAVNQ